MTSTIAKLKFIVFIILLFGSNIQAQAPLNPGRVVFTEVVMEGQILNSNESLPKLEFSVKVNAKKIGTGWGIAVLFNDEASVKNLTLPPGLYLSGSNQVSILSKTEGDFSFTFDLTAGTDEDQSGIFYSLPVPVSPLTRLNILLPENGPAIEVDTFPACVVQKEGKRISISPPGVPRLILRFKEQRPEEKPLYHVYEDLTLEAAPTILMLKAKATLKPIRGKIPDFNINIPPNFECLGVLGKDIQTWEAKEDGLVHVNLLAPAIEPVCLEILLKTNGDFFKPFAAPQILFPQATNISGKLDIKVPDNMTLIEEKVASIHRTQVQEKKLSYTFNGTDYELSLAIRDAPLLYDASCETLEDIWPDMVQIDTRMKLKAISGKLLSCVVSIPKNFTPLEIAGEGLSTWTISNPGSLELIFRGLSAGEIQVKIQGFINLKSMESAPLIAPWVQAARSCTGILGVRVKDRYALEITQSTGLSRSVEGYLPEWLKDAPLVFNYSGREPGGEVRLVHFKPAVEANAVTLAELTQHSLIWECQLRVKVRRAPLFEYLVDVGEEVNVDDVTGDEVASFERNGKYVRVMLLHPITPEKSSVKEAEIRILITTNTKNQESSFKVPLPYLVGTDHFQGAFLIRSRVEKEILWKKDGILTEIDPKDCPFRWFEPLPTDILLGYNKASEAQFFISKISPQFTVESVTLYTVGLGIASASSRITLDITRSSIPGVTLILPPQAELKEESLKNIECHGQEVKITFPSKVTGIKTLNIHFDIKIPEESGNIILSPVKVVDAEAHTGKLGYRSTYEIQLREAYEALKDLRTSKGGEGELAGFPNIYDLLSPGNPQLNLLISKVTRQEKAPAKALQCRLQTAMERDGALITVMTVDVVNRAKKQYLTVNLPQGANLWGAYVEEKPVKAGYGEKGQLLIPISSSSDGKEDKPISVKFIYQQDVKELSDLDLEAPKLDISTGMVKWEVSVPAGYRVLTSEGNMDLVRKPFIKETTIAGTLFSSLEGLFKGLSPLWYILLFLLEIFGYIALALACLFVLVWLVRLVVIYSARYPAVKYATVMVTVLFIFGGLFIIFNSGGQSVYVYEKRAKFPNSGYVVQDVSPSTTSTSTISQSKYAPGYNKDLGKIQDEEIQRSDKYEKSNEKEMRKRESQSIIVNSPAKPSPLVSYSRIKPSTGEQSGTYKEFSQRGTSGQLPMGHGAKRLEKMPPQESPALPEKLSEAPAKTPSSIQVPNAPPQPKLEPEPESNMQQTLDQSAIQNQSQQEMRLATRYLQQGDYSKAKEIYKKQASGPQASQQAIDALKNISQLEKSEEKEEKEGRDNHEIANIREEYLDRALAQVALRGKAEKDTDRLIEEKLSMAENRLLNLPKSDERSRALEEITYARRQIHKDVESGKKYNNKFKGESLPQNGKQISEKTKSTGWDDDSTTEAENEKMPQTESKPSDKPPSHREDTKDIKTYNLESLGDTEKSGSLLNEELKKRGYKARVVNYEGKLVVIGSESAQKDAGEFIAGLERKAKQQLVAGKEPLKEGQGWGGKEGGGKPIPIPLGAGLIPQSEKNIFTAVQGGRAKGALPIDIRIPLKSERVYTFEKALTTTTVPCLYLRCLPVGTGSSIYLGGIILGLLALQIAWLIFKKIRATRTPIDSL